MEKIGDWEISTLKVEGDVNTGRGQQFTFCFYSVKTNRKFPRIISFLEPYEHGFLIEILTSETKSLDRVLELEKEPTCL